MCEFVELDCPNECGRKLKRKDLEKHQEEECPNRTAPCRYCRKQVKWNGLEVCCSWFLKINCQLHFVRRVLKENQMFKLIVRGVFKESQMFKICQKNFEGETC